MSDTATATLDATPDVASAAPETASAPSPQSDAPASGTPERGADGKFASRNRFREAKAESRAEYDKVAEATIAPPPDADVDDDGTEFAPDGQGGDDDPASAPYTPPAHAKELGSRYNVVDAEGNALPVVWPDGTFIELKLDGKPRRIGSMDEMANLMQKGAVHDRVVSGKQQLVHDLSSERDTLRQQIAQSEDLLVKLLYGDDGDPNGESAHAYRMAVAQDEHVRRFRYPEARDGARALIDRERERVEAEARASKQAASSSTAIWETLSEAFSARSREFPTLAADDLPSIQNEMYGEYQAVLADATAHYQAEGVPAAQAAKLAAKHAFPLLSPDALAGKMAQRHQYYQSRFGSAPAAPAPTAPPKPTAAAHNARTVAAIRSAAEGRSIVRGGASPSASSASAPAAPQSWKERRDAARSAMSRD